MLRIESDPNWNPTNVYLWYDFACNCTTTMRLKSKENDESFEEKMGRC